MSKKDQGFTLIELMIVVAIIAIIASIAIPNLLSARKNANESAAIATLKNISSAQSQCQASGVIDANTNGQGEFGYFAELAGAIGVREAGGAASLTNFISPPVLSAAFGNVQDRQVVRSGYVFQMWLPGVAGVGVPEAPGGGVDAEPDAALSEVLWACYAWPTSFGNSGNRAFFVNQGGDVLGCRNNATPGSEYSGQGGTGTAEPVIGAAFLQADDMSATIAANTVGTDGNRWTVVN